jgi:hypothetical protein
MFMFFGHSLRKEITQLNSICFKKHSFMVKILSRLLPHDWLFYFWKENHFLIEISLLVNNLSS